MATKGVNKVILIGNLGKDPEVRYTPSGDAIANLTIATSESWKDKQTGEQKEVTEWSRVVAYGRLAQIMGEYLKKGSKVYIEGSLRTRKYEKNGEDRYVTEIRCNEMQMLDGRSQPSAERQQPSRPAAADQGFGEPAFDDGIPF